MLMLSLDDAVKVTKQLVINEMDDEEIIRTELEQKAWIPSKYDEPVKVLAGRQRIRMRLYVVLFGNVLSVGNGFTLMQRSRSIRQVIQWKML